MGHYSSVELVLGVSGLFALRNLLCTQVRYRLLHLLSVN